MSIKSFFSRAETGMNVLASGDSGSLKMEKQGCGLGFINQLFTMSRGKFHIILIKNVLK